MEFMDKTEEYKLKTITVPTDRPGKINRSLFPKVDEKEAEIMLPGFYGHVRAMNLDIFKGKHGEQKIHTFMPALMLHSWHEKFLHSEPDHQELAQIQHNWRKSTVTATEFLKEGLVFMGVSTSSFFLLCYASWWRFVPCVACVACVACVTCVPWCCGCRVSMLSIMWPPSRYATKHMPNSVVSPGPG